MGGLTLMGGLGRPHRWPPSWGSARFATARGGGSAASGPPLTAGPERRADGALNGGAPSRRRGRGRPW